MKIVSASDLHLEFNRGHPTLGLSEAILQNKSNADVLILAGDIFSAALLNDRKATAVLTSVLSVINLAYSNILYVMGNHEHYGGDFAKTKSSIEELLAEFGNFTFLEKTGVTIDGVRFFGGTMWTDLSNPMDAMVGKSSMNDYQVVKNSNTKVSFRVMNAQGENNFHYRSGNLTTSDTTEDYFAFIAELKTDLARHSDCDFVVVTHHTPSLSMCDDAYYGDRMNVCYHNNLDDLILDNPRIKRWYCGHTHSPKRVVMGECEIILNPKGYPGERRGEYCLAETDLKRN